MTDKIAIARRFIVFVCTAIALSMGSLFLVGCASTSLVHPSLIKGADDQIYGVSTQEALAIAREAIATVLPGRKMLPLNRPRVGLLVHENNQPGYAKYARFRDASYIYELDLIRLEGSTPQGGSVTGYTYAIKGNGDFKTGPKNVAQIDQRLKEAFDQSGRGVAVVSTRPAPPIPTKRAEKPTAVPKAAPQAPSAAPSATISSSPSPPGKPTGQQPPAVTVPMKDDEGLTTDEDAFIKLKKLKELLDQGIITEEEFLKKKKELLERI